MTDTRLKSPLTLLCIFFVLLFALVGCNLSERFKKGAEKTEKSINFFEGNAMQEAAAKLREKIGGPFKAKSVTIYSPKFSNGFIILQAQDPKKPQNIDRYEYRSDGNVYGPSPMQVTGIETGGDLQKVLFDFDEINFSATSQLASEALKRLKIEGGEIQTMTIYRNTVFNNDIYWNVSVEGPRQKGFARADAKGVITEAKLY